MAFVGNLSQWLIGRLMVSVFVALFRAAVLVVAAEAGVSTRWPHPAQLRPGHATCAGGVITGRAHLQPSVFGGDTHTRRF